MKSVVKWLPHLGKLLAADAGRPLDADLPLQRRAVGVLQPADLRGRPVPLVVPRRDPEDDGGLGGGVDVRGGQGGVGDHALGRGAAEHPHEGELGGGGGDGLGVALGGGGGRLDGEVDRVLHDVAGGGGGRLPGQVRAVLVYIFHTLFHCYYSTSLFFI